MKISEIYENYPNEWFELKKELFHIIREKGICKYNSFQHIEWPEKQMLLAIWCERFLMVSSFEEEFKSIRGLSDLDVTYDELQEFIQKEKTS